MVSFVLQATASAAMPWSMLEMISAGKKIGSYSGLTVSICIRYGTNAPCMPVMMTKGITAANSATPTKPRVLYSHSTKVLR